MSKPTYTRKITLCAVFISICVIGRILLVPIPSLAPNATLTILSGIIMGSYYGFIVGAIGMLISDLHIGAGLWTIGNVFFMGLIGFLSGIFWKNRYNSISKLELLIGAFLLTLLFDIGSSIWWFFFLYSGTPFPSIIIVAILGLFFPVMVGSIPWPFGLIHGFSTSILLSQILPRVKHYLEGDASNQ